MFPLKRTVLVALLVCCSLIVSQAQEETRPGLIGPFFGDGSFNRPKGIEVLKTFDQSWPGGDGHGSDWSATYEGVFRSPISGEVQFFLEANRFSKLAIDGNTVTASKENDRGESVGTLSLEEGKEYPIVLTYQKMTGEGDDLLRLSWSWNGQAKTVVPIDHFRHRSDRLTELKTRYPDLVELPGTEPAVLVVGRNEIVYSKEDKFAGWPANNGVWVWGNEILVAFTIGGYRENEFGHSIDKDVPGERGLARSLDGGDSWVVETFQHAEEAEDPRIDFSHPDLAIQVKDDFLRYSYDRGRHWHKRRELLDIGRDLTSRTDYLTEGKDTCYAFVSAKYDAVQSGFQDRAFCAVTRDGGETFEFLSWMTGDPVTVRSVMPSTVRVAEGHFVSAMRRRFDHQKETSEVIKNWIDVYHSTDSGKTWEFLSKVAETDTGKQNGNPPSMVRLNDGTLCVTYGYRAIPYGMRAKLSRDNGKTWSPEIGLRTDARTWDIGYPRSVVREDGKVVTIYYYTTEEIPAQHIAATIWDPAKIFDGGNVNETK